MLKRTKFSDHLPCRDAGCEPCRLAAAVKKSSGSGTLEGLRFGCGFWEDGTYRATLEWFAGATVAEVCTDLQRLFGSGGLEVLGVEVVFASANGHVILDRRFSSETWARAYARAVIAEIDAGRDAGQVMTASDGRFSPCRALLEMRVPFKPPTAVEKKFLSVLRGSGTNFSADRRWHHEHKEALPEMVAEAYRRAAEAQPEAAARLRELVGTVDELCDVCGAPEVAALVVAVPDPFDWVPHTGRPVRAAELSGGRVLGAWCDEHESRNRSGTGSDGGVPSEDRLRRDWQICRRRSDGVWAWQNHGLGRGNGDIAWRLHARGQGSCDRMGCSRPAAYLMYIANDISPFMCPECAAEHSVEHPSDQYCRWDDEQERWVHISTDEALPGVWTPIRKSTAGQGAHYGGS